MECRKCKYFVFVHRRPYMNKAYHYCDRFASGASIHILATLQSRRKVCNGKFFEPKEDKD